MIHHSLSYPNDHTACYRRVPICKIRNSSPMPCLKKLHMKSLILHSSSYAMRAYIYQSQLIFKILPKLIAGDDRTSQRIAKLWSASDMVIMTMSHNDSVDFLVQQLCNRQVTHRIAIHKRIYKYPEISLYYLYKTMSVKNGLHYE